MVKVGGAIGHYGLQGWWLNTLTQQQRDYIQKKHDSNLLGVSSLIDGPTDYSTSSSVIHFLTFMASWFERHADLPIAFVILDQAEKLILPETDVLDLHFLYGAQAKNYYKSNDPAMSAKAPKAALNQIRICTHALEAFKQQRSYKCPPFHSGFKVIFNSCIGSERFESAEKICRIALKTGWWEQSKFDKHMAEIEQERIWAKDE